MRATKETDSIIAVPAERAAQMVGVTPRRLQSWTRMGLLRPQEKRLSERNTVRLYTFAELVELNVIHALLLSGKSVRHVHRVADYLRAKGYEAPMRQVTFAVAGNEIYFQHPDGTWEGDRVPDQIVLTETLDLERIRAKVRRAVRAPRSAQQRGKVESKRKVMGSKPTFSGTRTPLSAVAAYIERGLSDRRIRTAFPHLTDEDIEEARKRVSASV